MVQSLQLPHTVDMLLVIIPASLPFLFCSFLLLLSIFIAGKLKPVYLMA